MPSRDFEPGMCPFEPFRYGSLVDLTEATAHYYQRENELDPGGFLERTFRQLVHVFDSDNIALSVSSHKWDYISGGITLASGSPEYGFCTPVTLDDVFEFIDSIIPIDNPVPGIARTNDSKSIDIEGYHGGHSCIDVLRAAVACYKESSRKAGDESDNISERLERQLLRLLRVDVQQGHLNADVWNFIHAQCERYFCDPDFYTILHAMLSTATAVNIAVTEETSDLIYA